MGNPNRPRRGKESTHPPATRVIGQRPIAGLEVHANLSTVAEGDAAELDAVTDVHAPNPLSLPTVAPLCTSSRSRSSRDHSFPDAGEGMTRGRSGGRPCGSPGSLTERRLWIQIPPLPPRAS